MVFVLAGICKVVNNLGGGGRGRGAGSAIAPRLNLAATSVCKTKPVNSLICRICTRDSIYAIARICYRLSVRPSVRHTGGS